jgi:hypothetical protein
MTRSSAKVVSVMAPRWNMAAGSSVATSQFQSRSATPSATTRPSNAPAPRRSHASTMFANEPDLKLSSTITRGRGERESKAATRLAPTNPAPPVTM